MLIEAAFYRGDKRFGIEHVEAAPPGPGAVQVEIAYCGICGTDLHVFLGHMDARIGDHRVIGHEMSGRVAAIGAGVEGLAPGDPVVVRPLDPCGDCPACAAGHAHICHRLKFLGLDTDGAFQQRWTVPAHTIHKLPAGMSMKRAALIEPLAVAIHSIRRARLASGEDALVIGGGPIGMLVAMAAQRAGARVSISEINPNRLAFARKMGFAALNPAEGDVAAAIMEATGGKGADIVFEVSGTRAGAALMTGAAATRGRICMVAIHAEAPEVDLFRFFWRELELIGARVYEPADFDEAIAWLSGDFDAERLITEIRPLAEIEAAFDALTKNPASMKTLLKIGADQTPPTG